MTIHTNFGKLVGVACGSFAITNVDDMFVLVTFFSESATSKILTPWRIVLGQYIGFTVIVTISLIGFGVSFLFATEPIGFMGCLPLLLGVWRGLSLIPRFQDNNDDESNLAGIRSVLKVALVTVMNGGDNIGTYIPLFSQARKVDIAIYIIIYYVLLAVWIVVAYSVMRQKHVLALASKHIQFFLPLLYTGLGLYIIINSSCFPWSIKEINRKVPSHPGKMIMSITTTFLLLVIITTMITVMILRSRRKTRQTPSLQNSTITPVHGDSVDDSRTAENKVNKSPLDDTPSSTQVEVHTVDDGSII